MESYDKIRWLLAAMMGSEAALGKAKTCCLLYCQDRPIPVWLPGNHSGQLEGRSSGLGHPTKLAGVWDVPLVFKITDMGLTPYELYELSAEYLRRVQDPLSCSPNLQSTSHPRARYWLRVK